MFDEEVANGGFEQLFRNSSGNFTLEILQSLRKIGSIHVIMLLETAMKMIPSQELFDNQGERFDYIQSMNTEDLDKLYELSQAYFDSSERLYDMAATYTNSGLEGCIK